MDLISANQKAVYTAAIDDIFDTFCQEITAVKFVRTPKVGTPTEDDNFDFTQQKNNQLVEFDESSTKTTVLAVVSYIDRQDKEYQIIQQEVSNISIDSGLIKIKIRKADEQTILLADNIIVDGLNTNVKFTNSRHGLFNIDYSNFYLERTP